MRSHTPRASIVVRCLNEEGHIGHLLERLTDQDFDDYEVIVVDSGSSDGTLEIVERANVTLLHIEPSEFSFGRSLNIGCNAALGEFIVVISAHCYPTTTDWLGNLLKPFGEPEVAVVYGRQRGNRTTRFSEHRVFDKWFPDESSDKQKTPFSNNANCAVRRDVWRARPYDETLPGLEDVAFAMQAQESGFEVSYRADATVVHVHDETWRQLSRRYRREAIALQRLYPDEHFNLFDFARLLVRNVGADLRAARLQQSAFRSSIDIATFRFAQFWGTYRGFHTRWPGSSLLKKHLYYPEN